MKLSSTDDQLVIQLQKTEMLYAFCRKLSIPKSAIVNVEWCTDFKAWRKLEFRAPGSYLPGVIIAGSYYSPDGWDFIYATKPKGWTKPTLHNVLVITTNKPRYRRLILSIPVSQAKKIESWFR